MQAISDKETTKTITTEEQSPSCSSLQITSIDGFFNRKRGRPPKNRFVEVYKNIDQKPQAIFTSFKLEKYQTGDIETMNGENSIGFAQQNSREIENETDNIVASHSCQKPLKSNFKQHRVVTKNQHNFKNGKTASTEYKEANNCNEFEDAKDDNILSCTELQNKKRLTNRNKTSSKFIKNCKTEKQFEAQDEAHALKKAKSCSSSKNVTVICAAGTYFPKNSNSNCQVPENLKEELNFGLKYEDKTFSMDSTAQNGNITAQDLSTKSTSSFDYDSSKLSTKSSSLATSALILPQIYNVFQMQQQLLLFYQQMALLSPATMPHLVQKPSVNKPQIKSNKPDTTSFPHLPLKNAEIDNSSKKEMYDMNINFQRSKSFTKDADHCSLQMKKKSLITGISNTRANKHSHNVEAAMVCNDAVKIKIAQNHNNGERVPAGYLRFRFNEDCGYEKCGYRQHQSHFHCNRSDCQYSFCDKTRCVQHTARHERLDTLMGSDFQQYRANVKCNFTKCLYYLDDLKGLTNTLNGRRSSHFHCLKCDFVCVDTNKVVAHRRFHSKMEFIRFSGFRKASIENFMTHSKTADEVHYKTNRPT